MKKPRYSVGQVAIALRRTGSGTPVPDVCRRMGVAEQILCRRKKRFAGTAVAEVRRPRGSLDNLSPKQYFYGQAGRSPGSLLLARPVFG